MQKTHYGRYVLYTMVLVPLYVFGVFVSFVFAPGFGGIRGQATTGPVTLSFVGDMMFDRYIRERAEVMGYDAILAEARPLFASSTIVLGNLEGPITTSAPVSDYRDQGPDHYRFTFATTVAATLHAAGITGVVLGNNHILNFGQEGLDETKSWLQQAGVSIVGAPDDPYVPLRTTENGVPIVVYTYNPWNGMSEEELVARLTAEDNEVFLVVFTHWGTEYNSSPSSDQVALAHAFVEAGADFVVGSHSHVIQPKELYRGTWIYYSLGNFVFDQYFSSTVRCGAVVTLVRDLDGVVATEEHFVELARDGRTVPSTCAATVPLLATDTP